MLKMGEDWNGQMGLEHSSDLMLGCPSLGLNSGGSLAEKVVAGVDMNSRSMFNPSNGGSGPSGWDPSESFGASLMVSHGNFANPSYPAVPENTEFRGTSQFMHHYSSAANAVEMVPKLSVFGGGGGSFSGMVNPYGLPGCAANKNMMVPMQSEEDCLLLKDTSPDAPPTGKRKRNAEGDFLRDASVEISEQNELDEKRHKIEENDSSDQCDKQMGGQTKDSSVGGQASKGDYVHIRARKGQATNSHSLAERVRREKINDRMKLLQELVPGCNKITGKAVMLDEIINYVQSLQQQVEFLSMKLASVNPELNFNIEQILSKEIPHLRDSSAGAPILGLNPGMSSSSPLCATGIHQGAFSGIPSTASPYHSVSQGMWDGELQRLLHMGFDSNPPTSNRPSGSSKTQI